MDRYELYDVVLSVSVYDPRALYDAARAELLRDSTYATEGYVERMLGTRADPDVGTCLRVLLDPGTGPAGAEILESRSDFVGEEERGNYLPAWAAAAISEEDES